MLLIFSKSLDIYIIKKILKGLFYKCNYRTIFTLQFQVSNYCW